MSLARFHLSGVRLRTTGAASLKVRSAPSDTMLVDPHARTPGAEA
jgi:hypothetical protein